MSLLPDYFLKSTVFIQNDSTTGTGFLIGVDTGNKDEHGAVLYRVFLVTNRHVIDETKKTVIHIDTESGIKKADIPAENNEWLYPDDVAIDLAIIPINGKFLKENKVESVFIAEDGIIATREDFLERVKVGQEVYLLGFPLGLKGMNKNFPIARQGIIARNDEELLDSSQVYLDINNFPGNSGGPIFVKPGIVSLGDRKPFEKSMLTAIVSACMVHQKTLFDNSTTPPTAKMIIEENSGVAIAIPAYIALDVAKEYLKKEQVKKDKEPALAPNIKDD